MKIGSLFDGSGGFPLAAAMCGGTPVWASEVEPYPIAVTRSRFPSMKHLGSVTDVRGDKVEPVDVITFGSPCQDLSVAGKRAGLKHTENGDDETTRSGLFMEAIRIIKEMRETTNGVYPRFAVWENVPGAFSSNKGEDFRIVLEEFIKVVEPTAVMPTVPKNGWPYADSYCGDGWSLSYRVFDAQFWGVPQRRRRIYLVADFRGECAGKVSFEHEGLRGYFAQSGSPREAVAGDAEGCVGTADCRGSVKAYGWPLGFRPENTNVYEETATTLCNGTRPGFTCGVIEAVPYTLKIRSGVAVDSAGKAAGKEALVQTNKAATLAAAQDQYLFQPTEAKVYESHPMDSRVKELENGVCPTCSVKWHKGAADTPLVCEQHLFENHSQDSRYRGPLDVCPMLPAQLGTGGNNQPFVVEKTPTVCIEGNGSRPSHLGDGWKESETMYTLNTIDQHAVAYAETYQKVTGLLMANSHPGSYTGQDAYNDMLVVGKEEPPVVLDRAFFNQGQNAQYEPQLYEDGTVPTLVARGPAAVCHSDVAGVDCRNATEYPEINGTLQAKANGGFNYNCNQVVRVRYIVRRLTPTECARLQGFPDAWGHPDIKESLSDEEYRFWLEVRNTHVAINGKATKEYTKEQMLKWYNGLHTDSAEYKMWGNGIALPCALYVMQGIAEAMV